MKIAFQLVLGAPEGHEWVLSYTKLLRKNMDLVKSPDTQIEFRIPKRGLNDLEAFFYSYPRVFGERDILESIIQAEKDGCDAVMVGCFFDPMVAIARQAVNIPLIPAAETSMLMAGKMGRKFGVVTLSEYAAFDMEDNIGRCGFSADKAVVIRPVTSSPEAQMCASLDAREAVEEFKNVARELIKEGAEVLIPGCLGMAPALRMAPGCSDLPYGLQEVDGVPIVDVVSSQMLMAEMMVRLKKAGSPWISRKGLYAQPSEKALKNALENLPYDGPGSWKC
jgi:Asp/Glu/hydantoin racemase